MYLMDIDLYECDFCGIEMKWDDVHPKNGIMWGCEKCGRDFCKKCFCDKHGFDGYSEMLHFPNKVLCPECWEATKNVEEER